MQNGFQITLNVLRVSRLFLDRPEKKRCGLDVARSLRLPVSSAYAILHKLQDEEWMRSIQEPPKLDGELGRRLYYLTDYGKAAATEAFTALQVLST